MSARVSYNLEIFGYGLGRIFNFPVATSLPYRKSNKNSFVQGKENSSKLLVVEILPKSLCGMWFVCVFGLCLVCGFCLFLFFL